MTKFLIAESVDTSILEDFDSNIEFTYKPDISIAELEDEIGNYDGLLVRPKQVTAKAIANADNLKLIVRGGAGVNSIDLEAAKAKGIIVANTPGLNSDATAEFTFNLLFKLLAKRQINHSRELTLKGNPGTPDDYMGSELRGKKIGLIGLGNIGKRVAKMADAFGMDIICYARNKKDLPYKQTDNFDEFLAAENDIISLHIPASEDTVGIINKAVFEKIKTNTILLNTARPQLVNAADFGDALDAGILQSYGIDGDYDQVEPFINADPKQRGIITHHIADCTAEAQAAITAQALKQAKAFFEEGVEINRVI